MSLLLVYNPVCGDCTAEQFFNTYVIPRLHSANRVPTEIISTRAPGDAGIQVLEFLRGCKGEVTVVLGSGDGTLHEIVDHLANEGTHKEPHPVHFVLVPCGTANALYASLFRPVPSQDPVAYKLQSLEAYLGTSTPRPLILSIISLIGLHHECSRQPVASIVVTSTALHAAILRDSEKFRKEIPGIERFKVAAQQNITNWYNSRVRLLPIPSSGLIHIYNPQEGDFVPLGNPQAAMDVHGPFAYFLSTVNVDRLEPEFRINPMISKRPPRDTSMDVVMVRPQRDPTFTLDSPRVRVKFAEKTIAVSAAAYHDGNHINLRYSDNGDTTEGGDGDTVVECFRCGGWEWTPDQADEDAHLLCVDGTIFEIEKGGRATCRAVSQTDATQGKFYVHI